MGLTFLPNQDFHKGTIYFDFNSNLYLKNHGFHINENHCKALMRASHRFRIFRSNKDEQNPFLQLPDDVQSSIVEQIEPALSRVEIESMRNRKI
jgi:hypothetical protein